MLKKKFCIFIGPPGAGKGSLSFRCVKELGYKQLSTGNLCRQHIAEETAIGEKIDFAIKSGKLISDGLIVEMVKQWMIANEHDAHAIIFDGFPRTIAQARMLHDLLQQKYSMNGTMKIIHLVVSRKELIRRMLERAVCSNKKCQAVYSSNVNSELSSMRSMICDECDGVLIKRQDDTIETIEKRLEQYFEHEKRLVDFYKSVGIIPDELQGEQPANTVFVELKNVLSK